MVRVAWRLLRRHPLLAMPIRLLAAAVAFLLPEGAVGDLGLWHFVDVHSIVCPGSQGWYASSVALPNAPADSHAPHVFSLFRSTSQQLTVSFTARDQSGKIIAEVNDVTLSSLAGTGSRRLRWHGDESDASELSDVEEERRLFSHSYSTHGSSFGSSFSPRRRSSYFSPRRRSYYPPPPPPPPPPPVYTPRRRTPLPPPPPPPSPVAPESRRRGGAFTPTPPPSPMVEGGSSIRRRSSVTPAPAPAPTADGSSIRRRSSAMPTPETTSATPRRRSASSAAAAAAQRRRNYVAMGPRRRYSGYSPPGAASDGRYQNQYNPAAGHYGYPSQNMAYQNFHGYPTQTPYGYSGANAYSPGMGSGTKIALAAAGGFLAGGLLGHMMSEAYPHHSWSGFGDSCSAGSWQGKCGDCSQRFGQEQCYINYAPPVGFARDDLMSSGFVPADHVGPILVNFTRLVGADLAPSRICPPAQAATAWVAPEHQDVFVALARVGELSETSSASNHAEASGGGMGLWPMLLVLYNCCLVAACAAYCCKWSPNRRGPRDVDPENRYGFSARSGIGSPPVARDVAEGFLEAMRFEYVLGHQNAVGAFLDPFPDATQELLSTYEDRVRASADVDNAIERLAAEWGLDAGGAGGGGGYQAVPAYEPY
eukprot:TRINITY_DN21381_c0_g1_i1.p1 TRINITY_DN21381_c0_g1~~TRINITY_DN21381_c0_g1_i1.p1  ORF type:complete len:663 (-),score=97.44 TRINITY_DN21381_c0_g1_i1:148-2091(-)